MQCDGRIQRYLKEMDLLLVEREKYSGILGKNYLDLDRSKYLKEVIINIMLLYKSVL